MNTVKITEEIKNRGKYDIIVAGGGVAGVAAALTAKKRGKRVLLIEKSNILGGLATLGLVNLFVPMCNGNGHQVIFGLADEWIDKCALHGFSTMPEEWKNRKNGTPSAPTGKRLCQRYSPYIFALQMTEMIKDAGIDLLFDCIASEPVMDKNVCKGLITESKSGREYIEAEVIIDTTGDCDILRRSGMPTVNGKNYFTYLGKAVTLESCKAAIESGDIGKIYTGIAGGAINLYGKDQPENVPQWSGTTVDEVSDYLILNQLTMLGNIKDKNEKDSFEVAMLPMMPNFRTTCHIDGDYTFKFEDKYKHFEDSVCAINDFDHRNLLFEVPYRTLINSGFPNLITAGRSAAAEGYGWDVLRVIPPAILTGQAAAEAAALKIETGVSIADVDIKVLQARLEKDDNIMIHFPDEWIPEDKDAFTYAPASGGHI